MERTEILDRGRSGIALRFLRTAVVIDDEAYISSDNSDVPSKEVASPGRRSRPKSKADQKPSGIGREHRLDVKSLVDSFATLGVICGVVNRIGLGMEIIKRADIVVLDWWLQSDSGKSAMKVLRDLLTQDMNQNALRLVAIYTGDPRMEDICESISHQLKEDGLDPNVDESRMVISYRHGRVVLYAKANVSLATGFKNRSIAEQCLPNRLVEDFSDMTEGLLPGIALTSLTAVREGTHMVLDQFCTDLDPAFLAHRACLSTPEDAERQMVNHIAEELRGLMDNAVADTAPAGASAVKEWIQRKSKMIGVEEFSFGSSNLSVDETVTLATKGLEASKLKKNAFQGLSAGFSGGEEGDLDARLARIMSFRTVFNAPSPTLWLGTIITTTVDGRHLLCMRPRCDCVRLDSDKETSFFFLPLVVPRNKGLHLEHQVVLDSGNGFKRLAIQPESSGWVRLPFKPPTVAGRIVATTKNGGQFQFADTNDNQYVFQGELKSEYAQRIVQAFAVELSRVAVDESEWLRRIARR